jgi:putative heme-binding domain-containing protein
MPRLLPCCLLLVAGPAFAAEPWADQSLPVTDGLALWLDAARQPAAHRAHDLAPPLNNGLLAACFDGSGRRLHLVQRSTAAQPRFAVTGRHAAVRFDGKLTFLELPNARQKLDTFTLFVVAAPRSNAGFFRGLVAGNQLGQRDYTSGFTVDLTGQGSARFDRVNVEGKGFGGAVNLLDRAFPMGEFRTLEVTAGPRDVRLAVDGKPTGSRPRAAGPLHIDELTLGARFYSNEPKPSYVQGHFDGDIAEVLLFGRALADAERDKVRRYLADKHAGLTAALTRPESAPTRVVANPPPVQVFVPGFRARQLPLDLPNVNNVRYRDDGKLVALAYNGDVYVLSDTDGDGLEDKADLFWENKGRIASPIGMALTPPGYSRGRGVFVASKGKVSLLLEGGEEVVVASGWKELPVNVDAIGVAVAKDGKVYFGLGTADYSNAYLLKGGKAGYDLKGERGTIQELDADLKRRRTFATGVRFSIGLAFNKRGDLFATDQEGATWLPNGNPFDELLHIREGRHYGFPPRHPKHLPSVIDEPSEYDYGPQHQSTCGLAFNAGFGPKEWADDVFVAGYARGKLYRTQLTHTPAGYVARNHLLASLNMLAADVCVSPKGDLVVAAHSGSPDWGSGPAGRGKIYKISYVDKDLPQPVAVWAAGPREVRVGFDRAVDPALLRDLLKKVVIEYGEHARAGDRFEALRPGYAVVEMQQAAPRRRLAVHAARLEDDGRTLSLSTDAHTAGAHYSLTLPGLGRPDKPARGDLPQHPEVDLDYTLHGVEAEWRPIFGTRWAGWLPHLDPAVACELLPGLKNQPWAQPERADFSPGNSLTLRTKLDLWQMLRPAVQPGSTLDHAWPEEQVTLTLRAKSPFQLLDARGAVLFKASEKADAYTATITHTPKKGQPLPLTIYLVKDHGPAGLGITYSTREDPRQRPLPLHRFLLPWAPVGGDAAEPRRLAELEGGHWLRGRRVFFSDEAGCFKCHKIRGEGGQIGPDLSNLVHRDYASVLKDIREPSAALNPDYINHVVELADGRVLTGVPRDAGGGKLVVGTTDGREVVVARAQVEQLTPSRQSVMPEGVDRILGPDKLRDLLTYLLTDPLTPAPIERDGAPPPRPMAEVRAVMKSVTPPSKPGKPLRILLAAGPKDHGPGEHDYPLWQRRWFTLLSLADGVKADMVTGWPSAEQFRTADVVVVYSNNPGWNAERAKDLEAFLQRGGGAVYLHYAVDGHRHVEALADRIGLAWRGGQSRFRHGALELSFAARHPLAAGFGKLTVTDESYWRLVGGAGKIDVLATGVEDGEAQPLLWTRRHGKGRVFVSILGHYNWTFDDPLFRLALLRGISWAAGEPADRLSELATVGARVGE